MNGFRVVEICYAPFARIRNSLEKIRGSPFSTDHETGKQEFVKAHQEVMTFLDGLKPDTLIRVVPFQNGNGRKPFLCGCFLRFTIKEEQEVEFTLRQEGGGSLCKGEFLMESIFQIEIWEKRE